MSFVLFPKPVSGFYVLGVVLSLGGLTAAAVAGLGGRSSKRSRSGDDVCGAGPIGTIVFPGSAAAGPRPASGGAGATSGGGGMAGAAGAGVAGGVPWTPTSPRIKASPWSANSAPC